MLDQTKAALAEISEEWTSQKRLIDQVSVAENFDQIVDAIDHVVDANELDIENMFSEEPTGELAKTWDTFFHCRKLLSSVSEKSLNLAAQELTKGKMARDPSKECKIYFYPSKIKEGMPPKSSWKSENYYMGPFTFNAGMYFNKANKAIIVVDCMKDPKVPPLKWSMKCKIKLFIRHKQESANCKYYYTEKGMKRNIDVTFAKTDKKKTSRSFITHNTGLTLSEIANLANGWIDLHTRTVDMEIDVKAVD